MSAMYVTKKTGVIYASRYYRANYSKVFTLLKFLLMLAKHAPA